MTASNWSDALKAREPELVCPHCDAANRPGPGGLTVHLSDDARTAACDACGTSGDLALFLPPLDPHKKEK